MSIYLKLFLTFLKIGAFSFGGGYAMIPLMRSAVINYGWLTEEEVLNFIAIAESTPGPIAVNMATFVGSSQAGILGSIVATLGVILPSFLVILLIAAVIKNLLKVPVIKSFLEGVHPATVALIVGTMLTMGCSVLFGIENVKSSFSINVEGCIILAILILVGSVLYKVRKKKLSPVLYILLSAVLGIAFYL